MTRPPRPSSSLGALGWAVEPMPAHTWAAIDTVCWRGLVIPCLVYWRHRAAWVIALSVATNLIAHLTARRAAVKEAL